MHVARRVVVDLVGRRHSRELVNLVLQLLELRLTLQPVLVGLTRPAFQRNGEIEAGVIVNRDRDFGRYVRLADGTAMTGDVGNGRLLMFCRLVDAFRDELRL